MWKWCDLDDRPHDRAISRHELFPIKAPLKVGAKADHLNLRLWK